MKTLYLLRHAKADLAEAGQDDINRPLNRKGERAASLVGIYLAQQGYPVRGVFASPATRAETTARRVCEELADAPPLVVAPQLYNASYDGLMTWLAGLGDAPDHILLVGHNPAIEDLAGVMISPDSQETPMAQRLAEKLPPASLVVLKLPIGDWSELATGIADLVNFVRPKDLV
ncbi:MAG: SixA phosphatase family protein [Alphaproteobacteria bacterium]